MGKRPQPKFRHIAVNGKQARDGTKYARALARAMNRLSKNGYAMQLQEHEHFTLVFGVQPTEAQEHHRHGPSQPSFSPHTQELMNRFSSLAGGPGGIETFIVEVKKQAAAVARGFNAEQLTTAANEIDAAHVAHTQEHSPECPEARSLRAMVEALRGVVQLQLQ